MTFALAPDRPPIARDAIQIALVGTLLAALATRLDVPVATWVRGHSLPPAAKVVLTVARLPGNFGFTLALAAAFATRAGASGLARVSRLLTVALVPSAAANVAKWMVGRTRPFRGAAAFDPSPFQDGPLGLFAQRNLSFPSGDAALAFATAAAVAAMWPRWGRVAWTWAAIVAVARVMQGAHYPSDVIAGAAVGTVGARLTLAWLDGNVARAGSRRPAPSSIPTRPIV